MSSHYGLLLTGSREDLSDGEVERFQKWLDDEADGAVPPIASSPLTPADLRRANELITHYARSCHNDWSEEWIRANLTSVCLATYRDWVDDLVVLCRSHHVGYAELTDRRFDPRPVGNPASVVHLRYLAVALRVADVMEVDPERTPEVILRHRDVDPSSAVYWHKDHYINCVISNNQVTVSSRPHRAHIHRAVQETVDGIEAELRVARRISTSHPFDAPTWPSQALPHRWALLDTVHRDITPRPGTYEYIDGAFRPDTQKLLQMLSGTELYGSPLPAIRELLQNAFDAIREQIAYERLHQANPAADHWERTLGDQHRVELTLQQDEDGAWLICSDDGVGMTKPIITNNLLVSGNAKRHDVLALERRCREAGFHLGRTGQFGIGVLSYFMIADRLFIRTRRSDAPRDAELTGWAFETEGAGSFGELRQDSGPRRGTEIRLHLRDELLEGALAAWCEQVKDYVQDVLCHVPCRFLFYGPSSHTPPA